MVSSRSLDRLWRLRLLLLLLLSYVPSTATSRSCVNRTAWGLARTKASSSSAAVLRDAGKDVDRYRVGVTNGSSLSWQFTRRRRRWSCFFSLFITGDSFGLGIALKGEDNSAATKTFVHDATAASPRCATQPPSPWSSMEVPPETIRGRTVDVRSWRWRRRKDCCSGLSELAVHKTLCRCLWRRSFERLFDFWIVSSMKGTSSDGGRHDHATGPSSTTMSCRDCSSTTPATRPRLLLFWYRGWRRTVGRFFAHEGISSSSATASKLMPMASWFSPSSLSDDDRDSWWRLVS